MPYEAERPARSWSSTWDVKAPNWGRRLKGARSEAAEHPAGTSSCAGPPSHRARGSGASAASLIWIAPAQLAAPPSLAKPSEPMDATGRGGARPDGAPGAQQPPGQLQSTPSVGGVGASSAAAPRPAMQVVGFRVEGVAPSPDNHHFLNMDNRPVGAGSPTPVIIPPSFQVRRAHLDDSWTPPSAWRSQAAADAAVHADGHALGGAPQHPLAARAAGHRPHQGQAGA